MAGVKPRNHSLTHYEERDACKCLEHDCMLYTGYDRQGSCFDNCLIDEFDFLKCPRHDMSDLTSTDWNIVDDVNCSIMTGGLRSPCPNARHFADHVDRVGRCVFI